MSAAGEPKPVWMRSQVKRSNAGGVLYNAVRIDTGVECDEDPSHDWAMIDRRVARLNTSGSTKATLDVAEAIRRVIYLPMTQIVVQNYHAHLPAGCHYATPRNLVQNLIRSAEQLLTQRDALEAERDEMRRAMDSLEHALSEAGAVSNALEAREKVLREALTNLMRRLDEHFGNTGDWKEQEIARALLATGAAK